MRSGSWCPHVVAVILHCQQHPETMASYEEVILSLSLSLSLTLILTLQYLGKSEYFYSEQKTTTLAGTPPTCVSAKSCLGIDGVGRDAK